MTDLLEPLTAGRLRLGNRLVMAPLTRNRAKGTVPGELNATYYAQRASVGLIITEGSQPSARGQGYLDTPGFHSPEQLAGWARVAEAVHAEGGTIVAQLMHVGRIAHPDNTGGQEIIAPSALAAPDQIVTPSGQQPYPVPRALATEEIPEVVQEFVSAARNAVDAGLDGVEVHAANGYLVHQFLAPGANHRTDAYGGSPAARARFAVEVVQAVAAEIGADRVGLRISPAHNIQGCTEDDPADVEATYTSLLEQVSGLGLAYLSILAEPRLPLTQQLRRTFGGVVIANDGFASVTTHAMAQAMLDEDVTDAVAVGRLVIANPDLVRRWREDAPLNEPDPDTFYGGGAEGYTDYPALEPASGSMNG